MGWELHIVRTENWFDSASDPISREEWLKLVNDDEELTIDNVNGDSYAIWSGQSEHDEPWLGLAGMMEGFQQCILTKPFTVKCCK